MSQHEPKDTTIDVNVEEGVHRIFTIHTPSAFMDEEITVVSSQNLLILTLSGGPTLTFTGPYDMINFAQTKGVASLQRYLRDPHEKKDVELALEKLELAISLYSRVEKPRVTFPLSTLKRTKKHRINMLKSVS